MDDDKTVTAHFTQDQYTLTINIVGSGSVVKDPNQSTYTYGTIVELTANADPGWSFNHWSGDLTGSDNPDTIVMDGDKTVTATFKEHTIVSILPSAQIVGKGETFDVSVYVEPGEPITGITIGKLSFNATLIHANSVILEGFFDPYNTTFSNGTINNINGEITNIYETTSPINNVSTDGYFCNISFTAQQEFGTSELDLEGVIIPDANGNPASITVNDGEVIIADKIPPQITNVAIQTTAPLDTDIGWENFSCTVTDNIGVDEVKLVLVGDTTTEYPMTKDGDDYYLNITISTADEYTYHIWADDINGNNAISSSIEFELPPNWDVDMDGKTHFMDLVSISVFYGAVGTPGWCREDVDNNGQVHFMDLVAVVMMYGEYWDQC